MTISFQILLSSIRTRNSREKKRWDKIDKRDKINIIISQQKFNIIWQCSRLYNDSRIFAFYININLNKKD